MALKSELAAAAVGDCCCTFASRAGKGAARTVSCKPVAIGCSMSWTRDDTSPVSYASLGRESQWLSESYLELRLRSSQLISTEVSGALRRHFESRSPVREVAGKEEVPEKASSEWESPEQGGLPEMLQNSFQDSIPDLEILLRSHLSRFAGPRGSFLDESWC